MWAIPQHLTQLGNDRQRALRADLNYRLSAAHQTATATAFVWIHVTQGEHRFAPNRRNPATIPGTPQDPGLDIDRAWWRARTGKPGHHYTELRHALRELAD
ncbi:hypothetical protein [Dactylosporangium sp. CA-233914]|uniref:hypothetical protein n=1 Tax=Dactylosporangium sp. CA-233914 TaxID=3239934 RepID=UPI003D8B0E7F